MTNECEIYKKALQDISRILDNVKYECCAREYTLDEDEMGWIFYCRDLAQKTLKESKIGRLKNDTHGNNNMNEECKCNLCDMIKHTTWISVEDRLPINSHEVLVINEDGRMSVSCHFWSIDMFIWKGRDDQIGIGRVTHWMPLPKPPTE